DSGGDGRHRGGPGSILELQAEIQEAARANTAGDGTRHAPYGILGGRDGLPHRYRLRSHGRRDRVLRTKEVGVVVRPGDVFLVESGGGGGYGDPRQRSPEARAYDRENGFVTRPPATRASSKSGAPRVGLARCAPRAEAGGARRRAGVAEGRGGGPATGPARRRAQTRRRKAR